MEKESMSILAFEEALFLNETYIICKYQRNKFTDAEWDDFFDYDDRLFRFTFPNEDFKSRTIRRRWYTDQGEEYIPHRWLLLKGKQIVGRAALVFYSKKSPLYDENMDTAEIYIDVDPEERRRGIGTHLLRKLTRFALSQGKSKFQSDYILDCSGYFCRKYGFTIASDRNLNRLYKEDINVKLLKSWANESIKCYQKIPEEILEDYCNVYTACGRMAPDYDGDYTASEQMTPEAKRNFEEQLDSMDITMVTCIAFENNNICGITELDFSKEDPSAVDQGLTGVLENYRKKGYGKALKARALLELFKINPKFKYIETGNNKHNIGMLKINEQLGFKVYCPHYLVTGDIPFINSCLNQNK